MRVWIVWLDVPPSYHERWSAHAPAFAFPGHQRSVAPNCLAAERAHHDIGACGFAAAEDRAVGPRWFGAADVSDCGNRLTRRGGLAAV